MKIGLMGYPGSGKDTVCKILRQLLPTTCRLAFGDKIREEVAESFGMSVPEFDAIPKNDPSALLALARSNDLTYREIALSYTTKAAETALALPRSPRYHLRTWATEYKRNVVSDRYWAAFVVKAYVDIEMHSPNTPVVVTDVRHFIEEDALRANGFEFWRILNDRVDPRNDHSSEVEWPTIDPDRTIDNNGTIEELTAQLRQIVNDRYPSPVNSLAA